MEYKTLSKKAIKLMYVTQTIVSAIVLVPVGIISFALLNPVSSVAAAAVSAVCALLLILSIAVFPKIRFKRYRYLLTDDRLELIEGIFWVERSIVPIDRIHQIDIAKGPLDNAFGVAKVIVTTAGSELTFRFLEPEKAEEIAMYLNKKLGEKNAE